MPTLRQKKAFKEVLNGSTISSAMVKAGYSETTASTTGKLTNTDGWKELMEKHLPDELLAKKHRELLNKMDEDGVDTQAVTKALDMGYKLKGKYAPEKTMSMNVELQVSPEIKELSQKLNELYRSSDK